MTAGPGTALVVVDMQNAFVAPSIGQPVDGAGNVVRAVNAWVADAVERGWPVFYTRDVAPGELPDGDPDGQVELCDGLDVRGTVVPKGPGKDGGFSGFVLAAGSAGSDTETGATATGATAGPAATAAPTATASPALAGAGGLSPLAGHLRAAEVDHLVVVGIAADVCVSATARDGRRLGYAVTVPLPATAFVHAHPAGDAAAVADLGAAGVNVLGDPPGSRP